LKRDRAVLIAWSEEDVAYFAITMQFHGCIADGKTQEEALANVKVAMKEWIEVAKEKGRAIPSPMFKSKPTLKQGAQTTRSRWRTATRRLDLISAIEHAKAD
jgi:predicted RNase H-like HicB family nuclease